MLNLQAVNHFYGNQHSLWNVDLVLRPGECIGVLGREGMGKTTLVNCIAGHLPVASNAVNQGGFSHALASQYANALSRA